MSWRQRLNVSPSRMELDLALKLQENGINHQTQVDIPVTSADLMISRDGKRPLLVFVDGPPHFSSKRADKDERVRSLLRENGFGVLELRYKHRSKKTLEDFYRQIIEALGREI